MDTPPCHNVETRRLYIGETFQTPNSQNERLIYGPTRGWQRPSAQSPCGTPIQGLNLNDVRVTSGLVNFASLFCQPHDIVESSYFTGQTLCSRDNSLNFNVFSSTTSHDRGIATSSNCSVPLVYGPVSFSTIALFHCLIPDVIFLLCRGLVQGERVRPPMHRPKAFVHVEARAMKLGPQAWKGRPCGVNKDNKYSSSYHN